MNKIKFIIICLLIPFVFLLYSHIRTKQEFKQKIVLAMETRKVLEHLMLDLSEAREKTFLDLPADGQWHNRIAFVHNKQGALEYIIKEGHLLRINNGDTLQIADHIAGLRVRRQSSSPDIFEFQIEARKNVSLISNLRIRIR